jgi:para-aminobenzoate synthetase component I
MYQEIEYCDPLTLFVTLNKGPWSLFFDSANYQTPFQSTNRYSYIATDPYKTFWLKNGFEKNTHNRVMDPFGLLKEITAFKIQKIPNLPPFQGGLAGYFGYDLCHYLEKIPFPTTDDMDFPDLAIGIYDVVISFDHHLKKCWIVSTGLPESDVLKRNARAKQRLEDFQLLLANPTSLPPPSREGISKKDIQANFTKTAYERIVNTAKEYIRAGDIFEVNLSQRFKTRLPTNLTPFALYQRLRQINPAPFSVFFNLGEITIASSSPERFLLLENDTVETRPIKGTTPRGKTPEKDRELAEALSKSEKDRSENVMIVDLMRNDLSRVCTEDSVTVETLCGVESYASIHHLVSVIKGKLKTHLHALDLLTASFPGGSITGVPKVRAMQIISELEPTRRGPYCGSFGFISFNGDMDTSIIIRTYAMNGQELVYQAGGAVVFNSNPTQEYQETLDKASFLTQALLEQ